MAYLLVPLVIFLLNWYTPWVAWPVILGIIYLFFRFPSIPSEPLPRKTWLIILAIVLIWVLLSGLGGYMYQNTDHWWRNAVLRDLSQKPWPVLYSAPETGDSMLCYYFAYWLPAALVGKCAGLAWAQHALYVWSAIGVMIFALLAASTQPKRAILLLLFLIFFSGVDLIPFSYKKTNELGICTHMECYSQYQYSSLSTCLFWVFNQALPAWIATLLVLDSRCTPAQKTFIVSVVFCFAPFPFIGLVAYIALDYVLSAHDRLREKSYHLKDEVKLLMKGDGLWFFLLSFAVVYLVSQFFSCTGRGLPVYVLHCFTHCSYGKFCLTEFLIPCLLMLRYRFRVRQVLIVCAALLIIPLIQIISFPDFVMRVSIPFILILALTFFDFIVVFRRNRALFAGCMLYLLIAAAVPATEMMRAIKGTLDSYTGPRYIEDLTEHANFSAPEYKESRYYKWLMKQ